MKKSHNQKAKLSLEKLQVTKLDNLTSVKGGNNAYNAEGDSIPTWPHTILEG